MLSLLFFWKKTIVHGEICFEKKNKFRLHAPAFSRIIYRLTFNFYLLLTSYIPQKICSKHFLTLLSLLKCMDALKNLKFEASKAYFIGDPFIEPSHRVNHDMI